MEAHAVSRSRSEYDLITNTPSMDQLRLASITQSFNQLLRACPQDLRPRQQVLTRIEPGFVFVEIRTSFKIPVNSGGCQLEG